MRPQPFHTTVQRAPMCPLHNKHPRKQMATTAKLNIHGVRFVFTPRSRGSQWTCSPCLKASVSWSRSPRSWCWLWIGATGWRSGQGMTGSGGPVRRRTAPLHSLVGMRGTFCSCCSSSCWVHRRMALGAGRATMKRFIDIKFDLVNADNADILKLRFYSITDMIGFSNPI